MYHIYTRNGYTIFDSAYDLEQNVILLNRPTVSDASSHPSRRYSRRPTSTCAKPIQHVVAHVFLSFEHLDMYS